MTIKAVEWPALSEWKQVLVRTWKEAGDDNVGLLAAGVAFYGFLAFVPLLASVVLTYGLIAEPKDVADHIRSLAETLPREAAAIIADQLQAITGEKTSSHGLGLLLAIALALYGASKGAGAVVTALNIAYEVEESRGFIASTALSLALTAGMVVMLLAAATAISALAFIEHLLPFSSPAVHFVLKLLFWALAIAVVGTGIALLYRFAPNRPDAPWRWITPGSAAATILWLLATLGFGLYVSNFGNYNATYGSLGGVVVFLTWLYLSAYILLMGGELNSELERQQRGTLAPAPAATPAAPAAPAPQPPRAPSVRRMEASGGTATLALLLGGGALVLKLWRQKHQGDGGLYYRYPAENGGLRLEPGGRAPRH